MDDMRPLWLYDGDCGMCEQGSARIRATVDPPVRMSAYQDADLDGLGVSDEQVLAGPVLVQLDGTTMVGPAAMSAMLRVSRAPFRQVGIAMALPGVRHVLAVVGPRLYAARGRLPGTDPACSSPVAPRAA
jgi:hypothetical protein